MSRNQYKKGYEGGADRFMSYFTQIDLIRQVQPESILEIGIGNKTVTTYLKNQDFNITTLDIDEKLKPDKLGDIRNIPFSESEFDVILACEILEHLPWEDFNKSIEELYRVTQKNVIISIPYSSIDCELTFKYHLSRKKIKIHHNIFRLPLWFKKFEPNEEHYWEMGRKGHSKKEIKNRLENKFKIKLETSPFLLPYHHFFLLEKK